MQKKKEIVVFGGEDMHFCLNLFHVSYIVEQDFGRVCSVTNKINMEDLSVLNLFFTSSQLHEQMTWLQVKKMALQELALDV